MAVISDPIRPNRIKEFRLARKFSHQQLADLVGTSRNTIGLTERSQQIPSLDLAQRIARALDTDVDTLFSPAPVEINEPAASVC